MQVSGLDAPAPTPRRLSMGPEKDGNELRITEGSSATEKRVSQAIMSPKEIFEAEDIRAPKKRFDYGGCSGWGPLRWSPGEIGS